MSRPERPGRPPARLERLLGRLMGGGPAGRFILGDLREEFARRPSVVLYVVRGLGIALRLRFARGLTRIEEGGGTMGGSMRDLVHGIRALGRRPAMALVVVGTLALGIGATTTVVSAVRGVLLAPLPYDAPERLVRLEVNTGGAGWYGASVPEFLDMERDLASLEAVAGFVSRERTIGDVDGPRRASVVFGTASLLPLLGVAPEIGRPFTAAEDAPGQAPVAVLSHGLWRSGFSGDPEVLGRTLTISGTEYTVVGVMPEGFAFPERGVEAWLPLAIDRQDPDARANHYVNMVGRLRQGADLATATAELERFAAATRERFPENYSTRGFEARLSDLHGWIVGPTRAPLIVLLVTAALVLVVACANVANLLLVRGEARRGEMMVRTALGASRGRLVRQLAAESSVLAVGGGLAGLGVALLGVGALVRMAPPGTPRIENVVLDPRMLLWAAVLTVGTGLLVGVLPALRAGNDGARATLGARGTAAGRSRRAARTRRTLLAVQVALATVLTVGAGLMLRTLGKIYGTDLGFHPDGVLAMDVTPPAGAYPEPAERVQLYRGLVERLAALPGVEGAGATCTLPMTEFCGYLSLIVEGSDGVQLGDAPDGVREIVTPSILDVLGLRVVAGRALVDADDAGAPLVALVNETMAAELWPGEEALGKRFRMWSEGWPFMEVVGVVADVRHLGPDQPAEPTFWVTHAQVDRSAYSSPLAMSLVLRTTDGGDPLALATAARGVVRDMIPSAAIARVRTLEDVVGATVALRRFTLRLLQGFSLVALLLAGVGIYGVMAMVVSERRGEMAMRKALGAAPERLVAGVLREGVTITVIGAVAGLAGGALLARWMRTLLYEVSIVDVPTLVAVLVLVVGVAAGASLLPAWRAGRVDPMVMLRGEG